MQAHVESTGVVQLQNSASSALHCRGNQSLWAQPKSSHHSVVEDRVDTLLVKGRALDIRNSLEIGSHFDAFSRGHRF